VTHHVICDSYPRVVETGASSGELRALDVDEVARRAMTTLLELRDVTRVGVALTEGGGRRLRFSASDRDNARAVDWCHVDAYDDVPLNTVVRTGAPVVGSVDELEPRYPELVARQREAGVAAIAALPVSTGGPALGGYVLFYDTAQPFDAEQVDALTEHGRRLADELRRAQLRAPRPTTPVVEVEHADAVRVAVLEADGEPRAVGLTRREVRTLLAEWEVDEDVADTALLCLSEVVTNAVIHTGAPSEVRVALGEGVLTLTVRDQGAGGGVPAATDDVDPLRVHGRGLQLVDALASRWGFDLDEVGTTVWFVLDLEAAS